VPAEALKSEAERLAPDLVAWRRDLHRHPELGFEEHRTAAFLAERLTELGLEVKTGVGETGVVGLLRAPQPSGAAVLLRADMDALPVREVAGREYGSTVEGRMHACGHDGHMAMMLGAARLLVARRTTLARDVLFCFQPAEEGLGGAERMLRDGVLEWVEVGSVWALHLWTPFPHGTVQLRPGPIMAAADEFTARIVGRGGHGAQPHLAADPVVAAAQAIGALQTIVSRVGDPSKAAVVTIGALHAGHASNVIPHEARLEGTMRCFDGDVREILRARVPAVLEDASRAAGCRSEFELRVGFPATVNDPAASELVRRVATDLVGSGRVVECAPLTAAEDFSFFLEQRPGAFILLGAGNPERGITAPHHSPEFDIDESVLPVGASLLAGIALDEEQPGSD
jgi:amidohydrolase